MRDVSRLEPGPDNGFLFAAHVEAVGGQDNAGAVAAFEAKLGRKLDAHRVFARWDDPLSGGIVAARHRPRPHPDPVHPPAAQGREHPVLGVDRRRYP